MLDKLQDPWEYGASEGVIVCIVASAPALQAGLSSIVSEMEFVEQVLTTSSLNEFDEYRAISDILLIYLEEESSTEIQTAIEETSVLGVLIMAADENEAGRVIPENPDQAWGVLPASANSEEIEVVLRALSAGLSIGRPDLVTFHHDLGSHDDPPVEPLTGRELEVLQLLAQGKANKQIAFELGISEHTVKFHISSMYSKLGASNRTEAVRLGVRQGVISL